MYSYDPHMIFTYTSSLPQLFPNIVHSNGVVELEKQWAKQVLPFAYQTDIKAFYSSLTCFKSLDELFTPSTTVFMVGSPYYGAMGEVQDSQDVIKDGRIRVVFNVPHEPQLEHLIQNQHVRPISVKTWTCHFISGNVINPHSFMWIFQKYSVKYCPGYFLASRLGISSYLVSRFSGSIFIGRGSKKKFVSKCCLFFRNGGNFCSCAVFCTNQPLKPGALLVPRYLRCKTQLVKRSTKKVRVTVKPHLLFRVNPNAEYRLFDRVVNIRESFTVPLGHRGTIIGIKGGTGKQLSISLVKIGFKYLCLSQSRNSSFNASSHSVCLLRCTTPRGYRLPPCALINLSHGTRLDNSSRKLTAIVKPQPATGANCNLHRLAGLNHSPRSPFVPTQVRGG
ncbi:hypothetical protein XENOCAPTIV_023791 [Xenoophorus captivus]|uniref:5'-3' exoribonuclease 1 SH3-like domain-containing protein n=1 Tax=Xenoophorus captivus TaxID=1517983 RepID=A0ABV0S989_9TELE